jgi:putative membrane protein
MRFSERSANEMMMGMMAFWLLIPAALIWMLRGQQSQSAPREAPDSALRILEARYARGEIDAEEFATRRTLIERGGQ